MNHKKQNVKINHDILVWARKNSGYSVFEITELLKKRWKSVDEKTLEKWEKGLEQPTFNQVIFLSEKYKRSLALFFLEKVPKEEKIPSKFRSLAEKGVVVLTPKVLLSMRKARSIQQDYAFVSDMVGQEYKFSLKKYSRKNTTAKELAKEMRELFNYSITKAKKHRTFQENFKYLRRKIEETNCLVLNSSRHNAFSPEDVRAFSFADREPFLINLTNADSETGKIFSLMHEFAHILLRDSSISAGNEFDFLEKDVHMEQFCNEFASNFLVDRGELIELFEKEDSFEKLASSFKVSPFVILIALKDVGLITQKELWVFIEEYKKKSRNFVKKASFAPNRPHKEIFSTLGEKVVHVFVQAQAQEKITYVGLSKHLDINRKYLPKVLEGVLCD